MMLASPALVSMEPERVEEVSYPPDVCMEVPSSANAAEDSSSAWKMRNSSWVADGTHSVENNTVSCSASEASECAASGSLVLPDLCEGADSKPLLNGQIENTETVKDKSAGGVKPKVKTLKYKSSSKSKYSSSETKHGRTSDLERTRKNDKAKYVHKVKSDKTLSDVLKIESSVDKKMIKDKEFDVDIKDVSEAEISVMADIKESSSIDSRECLDIDTVVNNILPADDYLLYDNRPISLLACGVWDCLGNPTEMETCEADIECSVMLIRKNVHSASDPLFSKWPCEAYVPAHYLFEIKLNSHGSPMGCSGIESGPFVGGHTDPRVRLRSDSRDPDKENEQIRLAKRLGLMQHLPQGVLDATTEVRECVICFNDLTEGQRVRYLPCMHLYHSECIDDWFQRSFTCPSCLEPVDAALLNTYNTT